MPYSLPGNVDQRPVTVVGAGTLGARIALMFAAGGSPIRIVNRTPERARRAKDFVDAELPSVRETLGLSSRPPGEIELAATVKEGVSGAWLVVESLAEDLDLKRRVLGDLDDHVETDALIATNSSSYPSSQMLDLVRDPARVLNMHFLMPPQMRAVELMSSGRTDESAIDALMQRLAQYGLIPFRVRRESVGFIFNRIWAAIKRESLMVVEEGVATHDEVDQIWRETFGTPAAPFRMMDQIGLDVVLDIEEHYAAVREGIPEGPRRLLHEYHARGHLGIKSGRGFYDDYADPAD